MDKNYAYHSGAFMALAKMFAKAAVELNTAEDEWDRDWAARTLMSLAEQTADTLAELGYEETV